MKLNYKPNKRPFRTIYEIVVTIAGIAVFGWWFLPFALLLLIDLEFDTTA